MKPLFFLICVVITITIIEAAPWYKNSPRRTRGKTETSNNQDDFGVEVFDVNGGNTEVESDNGYKSVSRGDQNGDDNQDNDGADVEQDGDKQDEEQGGRGFQGSRGFQGGQGFQGGRGNQGNYGPQGGFKNNDDSGDVDNHRYPPSRGKPSGRRNQNGDGNRREEDSESGDDSHEFKPKHSCRRCRMNNIGNGSSNSNRVFIHGE